MKREIISTNNAPEAIGTYSQAVRVDNTLYVSGQIPLDPNTMELVSDNIEQQIQQVFINLGAICEAAGGGLGNVVKFNVYLTDLSNFGSVNAVMERVLSKPYPARAAVEVSALPRGAKVEIDAIALLDT
ncbi:MAG: RidA family protein [Pseudomonadales bacterium]